MYTVDIPFNLPFKLQVRRLYVSLPTSLKSEYVVDYEFYHGVNLWVNIDPASP